MIAAAMPLPAPAVSAPAQSAQSPIMPAAARARLVVASSGFEIALPVVEAVVVGREDPFSGSFPEVDLTPHGGEEGGVSRGHLKIVRTAGGFEIEDLNSTNFTLVNRQKLTPEARVPLVDGSEILVGRVKLIFKVG